MVCGRYAEADVEPVREWLVLCDGDQRKEEPIVIGDEVAAVGFEREPEPQLGLVEGATRHRVPDTEVQVVEVHDLSSTNTARTSKTARAERRPRVPPIAAGLVRPRASAANTEHREASRTDIR